MTKAGNWVQLLTQQDNPRTLPKQTENYYKRRKIMTERIKSSLRKQSLKN